MGPDNSMTHDTFLKTSCTNLVTKKNYYFFFNATFDCENKAGASPLGLNLTGVQSIFITSYCRYIPTSN